MSKTLLYINDYACSKEAYQDVLVGDYPKVHFWGMAEYIRAQGNENIRYCNPSDYPPSFSHNRRFSRIWNQVAHLIKWVLIFIHNYDCDVIYSALPGYEIGFLLAKKLRIKNYNIVTVVHHPASRLMLKSMYDNLIFISKVCYNKYKHNPKAEFLFWGPDLSFYRQINPDYFKKNIDFIAAGKTLRDYSTLHSALQGLDASYRIIGEGNSRQNEISYKELLGLYSQSKFIVIPMLKLSQRDSLINGLTSFIDALGMGLPVVMSDNSNIGIDVDALGIGFTYRAGDATDLRHLLEQCLAIEDVQYRRMCAKVTEFAHSNSFEQFSKRINQIIEEQCMD